MSGLLEIHLQLTRDDFTITANCDIPANGISALFGPSGAGKTSLLRAIAGLEPSRGLLRVAGETWQDENICLPPHARATGYVFQEPDLFAHLSVRGNLEYGYKRVTAADRHINFDSAVELLGLAELMERPATRLSGGEQKRVAIARALLSSPKLLLMDEPLASLDVQHRRELMPFLERLHAGLSIPVIYVSHSPDEVARLADHLVLMDRGNIRAAGPIGEILTRFDLPVAHDYDSGAVLVTEPGSYDAEYDLTPLQFSGGSLLVPGRITSTGANVRVRVLARDISLTLEQQAGTSILNIVPATVVEMMADGVAGMLVKLDASGTLLLARITRKSAVTLDLNVGKRVFAQIKTVALLGP